MFNFFEMAHREVLVEFLQHTKGARLHVGIEHDHFQLHHQAFPETPTGDADRIEVLDFLEDRFSFFKLNGSPVREIHVLHNDGEVPSQVPIFIDVPDDFIADKQFFVIEVEEVELFE
jgi:hypothetical protein